jgi:pimeloyl-ACP methyl ester carboxylesterase
MNAAAKSAGSAPGDAHVSRVTIDGLQLEVARWGSAPPDRLPVLLLHEGLGSIALWRDFPAKLAAETSRVVFAYSRAGHGWSAPISAPRNLDYMHREAEQLPSLLTQLGLSQIHVLGHSDGASIALLAAARTPQHIASLILEAPHVFVEGLTVASIAAIGRAYATSDLGTRMARYHADPDHVFRRWNDIWLDPAFASWNIEAELPQVVAPMLLIQGRDDEYGTLEQLDRIQRVLPVAARFELPGCRHSPHRDQESAVLNVIRAFLNERS